MKRFDASPEWLIERIELREGEMDNIRRNDVNEENERSQVLRAKRAKSIEEAVEEVDVLIDTHFFNDFSMTKSSSFLKHVITDQSMIDMNLFKKTWRTLNCTPKTMKFIRDTQENLLCVGKRKEVVTKKKTDSKCWWDNTGLQLNAKRVIGCCKSER